MDGWPACIHATLELVPGACEKIAFDRLHVAKCLGDTVDPVRRQENRVLVKDGMDDLKGTQYAELTHSTNLSPKQQVRFKPLRTRTLKTARAWALKETALHVWPYIRRTWAYTGWEHWQSWAARCRLEPVKAAIRTSSLGHYQCNRSGGE